jgi:Protein of unknown function (DUF3617)
MLAHTRDGPAAGKTDMKRIIVAAAGAALVASCSGEGKVDADNDGKISMEEANKAVEAQGLRPEPGLYKATITMTGLEIPGMPPEMANHGAGINKTVEYCLTEEQVANGFAEMMKQGQGSECSYNRFKLDDGNMDAVMSCKTPQGDMRVAMQGSVTPTTSDFTATMAMNFEGAGPGTMKFNGKHQRVGDCPAK